MGITKFLIFLSLCAVFFLFYSGEQKEIVVKKVDKPLIEFEDSIMYDISSVGINQVIQSKYAYMYKNSEQLLDATILIKSNHDINKANTISAEQIVKIKDDLYLTNNVILENENGINIVTEELQYNLKSLKASNNSEFTITQNKNSFKGVSLYLDGDINHIKANNIHFKIELKDKNEIK